MRLSLNVVGEKGWASKMSSKNGHSGASRTRAVLARGGRKKLPSIEQSANSMTIRRLMATRAIKGRPENYVVIAGSKILDCSGTFNAVLSNGGEQVGTEQVYLVHKRDLAKVIGDKAAARFWTPGEGRVNGVGAAPPKPKEDAEPEKGGGSDG